MIAINLASRDYRIILRTYAGLLAGAVLLAVLMAIMLWAVISYRADISSMNSKLKTLAAAEERVRPVLLERERITGELSSMSALMDARRFSWTRLFTNIEAVFPTGAALERVELNSKERTLALEGRAQSPEALRNLMVGMEKSASFKDPFLKHQSVDKGHIFFNVVALYQEDKGAGVAQRK
ncbi:MAG TPA: PilN domain-containing protein [Nitrospirota bacterium]|jgi:Tfp pilus assembly protein PilN|nr:PilN domain-containing protein [Nitrospirota bacterium]